MTSFMNDGIHPIITDMQQDIPTYALGSLKPADLAIRLLDEIALGMEPVWPSTSYIADLLVIGFGEMRATRPEEVKRAMLLAPSGMALNWKDKFARLAA